MSAIVLTLWGGKSDIVTLHEGALRLNGERFEGSPISFLFELKKNHNNEFKEVWTSGFESVDWYSDRDIFLLSSMIDSDIPCCSVNTAVSSRLNLGDSTVGEQAVYLLWGYYSGHYPPSSNSNNANGLYYDKVVIRIECEVETKKDDMGGVASGEGK